MKRFFSGANAPVFFCFLCHALFPGFGQLVSGLRRKGWFLVSLWLVVSWIFWTYGMDRLSNLSDWKAWAWLGLFGSVWLLSLIDALAGRREKQEKSGSILLNIVYSALGCYFLFIFYYPIVRVIFISWQQNCGA